MKDHDIQKLLYIEKPLKSKLDKNSHSSIKSRDVMVLQANEGGLRFSGEIHEMSEEPTKYILERMIQHIKNMAEIAIKHHIADNFKMVDNQAVMRPEAENNITRLIFTEFSFYPSTERGPLTELEFKELMEQLVEFAKTLPPNLHLVLSSFPVVEAKGNVHNVASYIQCNGKSADPIITNFAKAVPSDEDVVYPGTKNTYFTQGHRNNAFTYKLKRHVSKLAKELGECKDFQESAIDLIDITLSHCASDSSLSLGELISKLNELRNAIREGSFTIDQATHFARELIQLEKEFRDTVEEQDEKTLAFVKTQVDNLPLTSRRDENFMLTELSKQLKTLLKDLNETPPIIDSAAIAWHYTRDIRDFPSKAKTVTLLTSLLGNEYKSSRELSDQIKELHAIIPEIDSAIESNKKRAVDYSWSHGGNLRCVTQGGVEFTTAVDICYDHSVGVAKRSHQQNILKGMQSLNQAIDSQVNHLITSNTVFHYSENIISQSFTHVDANPVRTGVFDRSSMRKQDPEEEFNVPTAFGSTARVHVAIPREIGRPSKEVATLIDRHNQLFIKVEALRILDKQKQMSPITGEINQKLRQVLGEFAVKDFERFLLKNEIAQLRRLAENEFKKEGVHIHSDSLGTVFLKVQDRFKDFAQLLQLLSQLFSDAKPQAPLKQLIAKMMLNKVIAGCEHWSKVCPKTQEKVLNLMGHALLQNDHINFSNSQQLNKIVTGLEKQLQEAIVEKKSWKAAFYKSATKEYDIHFDNQKGLSNARVNSLITTTADLVIESSARM